MAITRHVRIRAVSRWAVDPLPTMRTYLPYLSLLLAGWFVLLFHRTGIGVNLLLFDLAALTLLWTVRRPPLTLETLTAMGGTMLTALFVVLHGSTMAILVNILALAITAGVMMAPSLHAVHHAMLLSLRQAVPAQGSFLRSLGGTRLSGMVPRLGRNNALPLLAVLGIVGVFFLIYRSADRHFAAFVHTVWEQFDRLLAAIDPALLLTFMVGLFTTNALAMGKPADHLLASLSRAQDALFRHRRRVPFAGPLALRYETRTGLLLLGALNALLLVVNLLDIRYVWFGFRFEGQYLKDFVHEGTGALILSILLGAAIVLWYFRGNQNFLRGNATLKALAYVWLVQNALLTVSVAIRNGWYIHYYALAYKRIGVLFFLLAVAVGLLIVLMKVRQRRTGHFVVRWNAYSIFVLLVAMAAFDWDVVIARYNFAKKEQSFVHLDFMATLADKALPWLIQERHALEMIDRHNRAMLESDSFSRTMYMEPVAYGELIAERTGRFVEEYPTRDWRQWNLADARAYRLLTKRP